MMLRFLLALLVILQVNQLFGQSDSLLTYTAVIPSENSEKGELFNRARSWFNNAFMNSKEVIQIADKEAGEISGKGLMIIQAPYSVLGSVHYQELSVRFTCNIWVKDNRYKYEFSKFNPKYLGGSGIDYGYITNSNEMPIKIEMVGKKRADKFWVNMKQLVDDKVKGMIQNLKEDMAKVNLKSENW